MPITFPSSLIEVTMGVMNLDESRPYADKTTEQLSALAERVDQQLEELGRERAMLQAELRLRSDVAPVKAIALEARGNSGPIELTYLRPQTVLAHGLVTGDSYADAARHYALRWVGVAAAVLMAGLLALGILGIAGIRRW
jgi:hypothetical protein